MLQVDSKQEQGTAGRIRGFVVESRLRWVVEYFGERVLERVLAALPAPLAAEMTAAGLTGWCPLATLMGLESAIADVCGRNERQLSRDLGRYVAHTALSPRYRPLRGENLHQFFQSAVIRDALFQEGARGSYDALGPGRGRLSIFTAPGVSAAWCRILAGYLEQVVLIHGESAAIVIEKACRSEGDATCTFDIEWQGGRL